MKNQANTKKVSQEAQEQFDSHFAHGDDEAKVFTIDSYIRLARFATGEAAHADRQTIRIRLLAGFKLLEKFEYNAYNSALLSRAYEIVTQYRPQAKREVRKVDVGAMDSLRKAMVLIDELIGQSDLWDQVLAYKHGEDAVIIDADKYEYAMITVH